MKVFIVICEPGSKNDEFEGNDFNIIGVFSNRYVVNDVISKDIKNWHYSCGITEKNYLIEECEVDKVLK